MLEWPSVEPESYTNPLTGERVEMRLIYAPPPEGYRTRRVIDYAGENLTLIAHRFLSSAEDILKLCMANAGALIDHDWNLSRIRRLVIPE